MTERYSFKFECGWLCGANIPHFVFTLYRVAMRRSNKGEAHSQAALGDMDIPGLAKSHIEDR